MCKYRINTNSKVQKYKLCITWKVEKVKTANSKVQKCRVAYARMQKDANVQIPHTF